MTRAVVQQLVLFFLPFAAFAIYLLIQRRNPMAWSQWSAQSGWLVIAGLAIVVVSLIVGGITAERQTGGFVPTHVEDGRVVPGRFN
ncbi:DUF6111 family protein [Microvirga roseola]|uniref:DUF6111 family protein n=1 Tax=Microvirga roseola TaxID=2883126 RepID=UPI001E368330|nr:DUF6111 family protein [Microvirga roseola]